MPQIISPPGLHAKLLRLRLELKALQLKEKLFGKLSGAEQKRMAEIMRQLTIKY